MDLQLTGKRAIITGGSRGIGWAVADALAAEGADVVLVARNQDELTAAAARIDHGTRVLTKVADTNDDEAVQRLVDEVVRELGGVDILVNGAARPGGGGGAPPKLADLTDDAIRSDFETKVLGYLRCIRAVAPHMQAQHWGRIINISGLAARSAGTVSGSLRNAAVASMTKNLADELGPDGINVTVVHPGMTVTERTAGMVTALAESSGITEAEATTKMAANISIGRLITAAEVATVVTFLASPLSVSINGDAIAAGGGAKGPIYY